MDPLRALDNAVAVVQFADFSFRLIKSAHELYKPRSGQRSEYIKLSTVSPDLWRLTWNIKAKLGKDKGSVGEIFLRLHDECISTNNELQLMLNELKARGTTKVALAADGLRAAFTEVRTAGDIDKLTSRLDRIRHEMNLSLLYLLWDEPGMHREELRQISKQQADIIATLSQMDHSTKQFSTAIIGVIDKWPINDKREITEKLRYLLSDKWNASTYAKQTVFDENQDEGKLDQVRHSLYFESISYRETSIYKRHKASFEWVFHEPRTSEDGYALWSDFPSWLRRESSDIYWFTGKPGAGKSTLLKFISQDSRFENLLQEWANGSQLLVTRFFAWAPGISSLQKSQEGLFKTILLEAIQQQPQLAINIFPARWFLLQSFNENVQLPKVTMEELRVGFQNLVSATGDRLKLVLLIDGLDELDEDYHEDHRGLVNLLRDANAKTGVKICASSRLWNIFRDEYGNSPMLQLEDLTRDDIVSFVKGRLQSCQDYSKISVTHPQEADKFITNIVDKSQGVFLWASLVSGLLETALQEGSSISDLQATIDTLPEKDTDLFDFIWNRTSKRFRAEASQYFRLMKICQDHEIPLFALILWFGGKEIPVNLDAATVTSTYLKGVIKSLERRLISRTGGLLELVSSDGDHTIDPEKVRVDYMHPAASDWVRNNWGSIISATDLDFDPYLVFIKGKVLSEVLVRKQTTDSLELSRGSKMLGGSTTLTSWRFAFNIASSVPEGHPDRGTLVAALNRLDNYMVSHMSEYQGMSGDDEANRMELYSLLPPVDSDLTQDLSLATIPCNNFPELAARMPIPAYVTQMIQQKSDLLTSAKGYGRILDNIIFGQIWFPNNSARFDLLHFITQEEYCAHLEWLHDAKAKVEQSKLIMKGKQYQNGASLLPYFGQITSILGVQLLRVASQGPRNEAGMGGYSDSLTGTSIANDPRNKTPKPKLRDELPSSIGKLFRRKKP